jgi:hypothetical protein
MQLILSSIITVLVFANFASASDRVGVAQCQSVIDGAGIQLTIVLDRASDDSMLKTGVVIQQFDFTNFGDNNLQGPLTIENALKVVGETSTDYTVQMSVYDAPTLVFAEFTVPKAGSSEIDIRAKTMGNQVWGHFWCRGLK